MPQHFTASTACSEHATLQNVSLRQTETDIVGTLMRNSLVAQVGEDKAGLCFCVWCFLKHVCLLRRWQMLKNGIARMFIESIDPIPGIKGWVTRTRGRFGWRT